MEKVEKGETGWCRKHPGLDAVAVEASIPSYSGGLSPRASCARLGAHAAPGAGEGRRACKALSPRGPASCSEPQIRLLAFADPGTPSRPAHPCVRGTAPGARGASCHPAASRLGRAALPPVQMHADPFASLEQACCLEKPACTSRAVPRRPCTSGVGEELAPLSADGLLGEEGREEQMLGTFLILTSVPWLLHAGVRIFAKRTSAFGRPRTFRMKSGSTLPNSPVWTTRRTTVCRAGGRVRSASGQLSGSHFSVCGALRRTEPESQATSPEGKEDVSFPTESVL
ncbi:uncharacterized protein LOC144313560 [Canis aureus]